VSPLWRDELRVVLAPEQVVLVRLGWALTRRGLTRRVMAKAVVDCASAGGETPWGAAITTLEAELPHLLTRRTVAKVILSNHFMRYALIPWSETLSDAAEEEAYARHFFRQAYGTAAEHWELRLSPERAGLPQLASAVDSRLLAALRAVFVRHGVALDSIQPRLMAAYNNCRPTLHKRSAWFVMVEPGCLCLALLQHGRWASVRTMRIGSDWHNTLAQALDREVYMAEAGAAIQEVFLWAPELGKTELPESGRWQIHHLQPLLRPAFLSEYEGRFATALSV
jgi:hypothetical protein